MRDRMVFAGINYLAVLVAAVGGWLLGAAWYALLGNTWMAAVGKTKADLVGPSGKHSPIPFVLSFVALVVMAAVLAEFISYLGPATTQEGITVGFLAWLGFVITSMGVNHAFTSQRPALTAIDGGHWLAVLLLQGAVIGAFGS
jgi:hypothetical protein